MTFLALWIKLSNEGNFSNSLPQTEGVQFFQGKLPLISQEMVTCYILFFA